MCVVCVRASSHLFWAPVCTFRYELGAPAGVTQKGNQTGWMFLSLHPPSAVLVFFAFQRFIARRLQPSLICMRNIKYTPSSSFSYSRELSPAGIASLVARSAAGHTGGPRRSTRAFSGLARRPWRALSRFYVICTGSTSRDRFQRAKAIAGSWGRP